MINTASSFHDKALGQIIAPVADLYISFAKNYVDEADFFVLDESELGVGLLAPNDGAGVLQMWDKYDYSSSVLLPKLAPSRPKLSPLASLE